MERNQREADGGKLDETDFVAMMVLAVVRVEGRDRGEPSHDEVAFRQGSCGLLYKAEKV